MSEVFAVFVVSFLCRTLPRLGGRELSAIVESSLVPTVAS